MTVRDFWLVGEVLCMENWTGTHYCSRTATERLFRREAEACWAGTPAQLPCQQRNKIEAQFAPTEYSWAEIRKLGSNGTSGSQPSVASKPGSMQNGELGTVSILKAGD